MIGKSTLLEVLAARKTTGRVTGDILFNGKPCSPEILKASAYIMQGNDVPLTVVSLLS